MVIKHPVQDNNLSLSLSLMSVSTLSRGVIVHSKNSPPLLREEAFHIGMVDSPIAAPVKDELHINSQGVGLLPLVFSVS